ncbi:dicarboxylate/amino acid:cation symporter [bacterium]|nr:dicarboxylate/amino acid:cation symporter [bacterium]
MKFYTKNLNGFLFASIVFGFAFGVIFPEFTPSLKLTGELFIRLLTLLIIPVIFFSMLSGVLNLQDSSSLARIGVRTFLYYTATTALAVLLGLVLVRVIQPGLEEGKSGAAAEILQGSAETGGDPAGVSGGIDDVLRNIIPDNIVEAMASGNVLGTIFFSIFLGIALLQLPPNASITALRDGVQTIFSAIIWMIDKVMLLAPIGFFALIAELVGGFVLEGQLRTLGDSLVWYTVTVMLGLLLHGIITLGGIALFFRINPLTFFQAMFPALLSAFSTASSSATLPITLDCLERRAGVPNRISSFVAPLGATINMDGTAIYEAVAVVFIANMLGVELSLTEQALVFLTATVSAVGAAGIPGAGLIMMVLILQTVGLPPDGVKLVIVVDRALDMLRTATNVWGDSIGAAIIASKEPKR